MFYKLLDVFSPLAGDTATKISNRTEAVNERIFQYLTKRQKLEDKINSEVKETLCPQRRHSPSLFIVGIVNIQF